MGWVDLVPRCGRIYIGGLYALYQTDLIEAAGITHVLSVIDYDALLQEKFKHLKHLHISAEDHPNTNLLQYFECGVNYIDQALAPPLAAGPYYYHQKRGCRAWRRCVCSLRHGQIPLCYPGLRLLDLEIPSFTHSST